MTAVRWIVATIVLIAALAVGYAAWTLHSTVSATVETEPVPSAGDAADDPAIYAAGDNSLVIGTNKKGSMLVYDMAGMPVSRAQSGPTNNVDIRKDFPLGGRRVPLVVASRQDSLALGIYRLDPANKKLVDVSAGFSSTLANTYGLCMYVDDANHYYAFVTAEAGSASDAGEVQQIRLSDNGSGRVTGRIVRKFDVSPASTTSQAEGCVADDRTGNLYIGEEEVAIWKYGADPSDGFSRTRVDGVVTAGGHLTADIEGVVVAGGYLLASSQGEDRFAVYRRDGDNTYLGEFRAAFGTDVVRDTDGIDATDAPLGPGFHRGAFVAQDGRNTDPDANQNFKYVPLQDLEVP